MTRFSLRACHRRFTASVRPGCAGGGSEALLSLREPRSPGAPPPSAWLCGPLDRALSPGGGFRLALRSGTIHIEVLGHAVGGTYNHSVAASFEAL